MKKSIQLVALFALTLLGSCTGGNEQKAAEKVEEKTKSEIGRCNGTPCRSDTRIHGNCRSRSQE